MNVQLTFDQAQQIAQDSDSENFAWAVLSDSGRVKVVAFADAFYDGKFYNESAVFSECEQSAEDLLRDCNHIVEFKRVEGNRFVIDNLELVASDFDWMINA